MTNTGTETSRRGFLSQSAGGFTLAFFIPEFNRLGAQTNAGVNVNAWLHVGTDESITLSVGASEMGQGSFSALAQILAEELMVDYAKVRTIQGLPSLTNPVPVGASINTVGSSVTRSNFWKMRDAGAAAREMLIQAAMNQAGDPARSNFSAASGVVTWSNGNRKFTYGQLAAAAALLTPPATPPLVPDSQFRLIGKTQARFDIPSKTDGSAQYGIDVRLPNMVYAVIKHCPTFGGTLVSTGTPPQGSQVIPCQVIAGTGRGTEVTGAVNAVAVTGPSTWDAWRAARRLTVNWKLPADAAQMNTAQFLADAAALVNGGTPYVAGGTNGPKTVYTVESTASAAAVQSAIDGAAKKIDVQYTLPYVAHACMEVLNCTVHIPKVNGLPDSCEIWAPTQNGRAVLQLAVTLTGLPAAKIKVHTTYLGGGLGRKAETDFVSQAIQTALVVNQPVKLMWPREEDFTRDQYRPMALVRVRAGVDGLGRVTGWAYRNISPSILGQRGATLPATGDSQGYESSQALPYNFGGRQTEWVWHPSQIPVGFWRSVGASINTFAVESAIDELAALAGQDPYLFRRSLLTDPRWIAVLDKAASLANWTSAPPSGRARGIAIGSAFNSIVAQVVEISSVSATSLRVNRVAIAIDCYMPVNPGQIEAQLQGGIVHGMNAALFGQQTFVNGAAQARNFNRSRMILLNEMPQISIGIIPPPPSASRTAAIGGAGELGVPAFAPALANAYFKLTGKRQRSLPFFPGATMDD
jgi:isoquinoline 1-oxidoreductase beta subunit